MAWARAIGYKSVYITRYHSMKVPISFRTLHAMANKNILVDSGARDNFIHPKLLKRLGLGSQPLERPRKIWNIDGTTNKAGALTLCVDLEVRTGTQQEVMKFLVTDLGGEDLILGYPWLSTFELKFRWRDAAINTSTLPIIIQSVDWRKSCIKCHVLDSSFSFPISLSSLVLLTYLLCPYQLPLRHKLLPLSPYLHVHYSLLGPVS